MPKKTRRPTPKRYGQAITIGKYTLCRPLAPDSIWILHVDGEAMMTPEDRLERAIARYFEKEF